MSNKEPESETPSTPQPRRKRLKRIALVLLVLFTGLGISAYYAQDWMIDEMRTLVVSKLEAVGVYVDYTAGTRSPVRGAVLKKISFYETEKKEKPLLTISNLGLFPSLKQWLLEGEISIVLSLKDSEVILLADGEEVERLQQVTSVMKAGVSGVTIKHLSAVVNGVDYEVRGRAAFGGGKDKEETTEDIKEVIDDKKKLLVDFSFLKPMGEWLSLEEGQGRLKVISDFNVDVADLDGMTVNSQFSGESFVWHGVAFDHIKADVSYAGKDRSVNVKSFATSYRGKPVAGELRYVLSTKTLEITRLDSQLDILSWIKDYSGKAAKKDGQDLVLIQAPHLGLSGKLDFSDLKKSDLKIELLESEGFILKTAGHQIAMQELKGELVFSEGVVSILDPGIFARVGGGEFHLSGESKVLDSNSGFRRGVEARFNLSGKSFEWHGVDFDHARADVIYSGKDRLVEVKSFDMGYRGKTAKGECHYAIPTKTLEITSLQSQLNFLALLKDYSGKAVGTSEQELVLIQAPHVGASGRLDFSDLKKSDLKIEFLDVVDVVLESGKRQVNMKELAGRLSFAEGRVSTLEPALSAKMADGEVHLSGNIAVMSEEKPYQASLVLNNVSVHEMDVLIRGEKGGDAQKKARYGRLYFDFSGSGDSATPVRNAKGKVKIEDAQFYSMPLFGSFFTTVNKVVPTFGNRKTGEKPGKQMLTGTYLLQDGVIRTDDLDILGDVSQVVVKANYDLQEKSAVIDGKIELKGVVGIATGLASNLLELEGVGPLNDLKWKLKNLNAAGVVKGGVKGVSDASKGALKMSESTVKGAAEISGKGAKTVIDGAGKIGKGLKQVLPFKKKE